MVWRAGDVGVDVELGGGRVDVGACEGEGVAREYVTCESSRARSTRRGRVYVVQWERHRETLKTKEIVYSCQCPPALREG